MLYFVRICIAFVSTIKKKSMCKVFILKNASGYLRYFIADSCGKYYSEGSNNPAFGLCEAGADYNVNILSCRLYVDEYFDIYLPMNGNIKIPMEPLPKAVYLLILRHPAEIVLKNIADYREELEYIYREVSGRKNSTVIRRLIDNITNPLNNMLHKNLSIIRAAFLKKLSPEDARLFIPVCNRGGEQYVLLDASCIKWPKNLH